LGERKGKEESTSAWAAAAVPFPWSWIVLHLLSFCLRFLESKSNNPSHKNAFLRHRQHPFRGDGRRGRRSPPQRVSNLCGHLRGADGRISATFVLVEHPFLQMRERWLARERAK